MCGRRSGRAARAALYPAHHRKTVCAVLRRITSLERQDDSLQVLVRDNNVEQALRVLKKKMQREGVFREMRARRSYEKPSERRAREKAEAIRRSRKAARKQAQREGLIPGPKKKPRNVTPRPAAPSMSRTA
jgi:small subunit ribosomal protein S21